MIMAHIEIEWTRTSTPIRINEYAQELGFNLTIIEQDSIPTQHWEWIDNKIRNSILYEISDCWEKDEWSTSLYEVNQGIYVINLADNLYLDYDGNPSPVMYIGRGQIMKRISSHLKNWIRNFSESLQGISFNIWMTEIKVRGLVDAFLDVETDLLDYFYDKFNSFPIQNTINGRNHYSEHEYNREWNKPLWNPSNIKNGWSIQPLDNNPWNIEFENYGN
jgi:hypothetical protein